MSSLLQEKWFLTWMAMGTTTPLLSFFAGLGYLHILVIVLSLGQVISLSLKKNSRYSIIWILQSVYWIIMIQNFKEVGLLTVSFGSILLGELLLGIIFKNFGNFFWTGSSLLIILMLFLVNSVTDMYSFIITNDVLQIILVFIISFIGSFFTGFAIEKAFPVKHLET